MQRISVIGTSGPGKTTLARALSQRLRISHIELDALHWEANWTPAPADVFRSRVTTAIAADAWTMCGNYGSIRDMVLARADTIIWLDYSLSRVLLQTIRRTFHRCWHRQLLWAGNRESFYLQLCTRESMILWVLNTWRRRRREYPKMLRHQASLGKRVLRFRTPDQTRRWLATKVR
jgi:adenylate kinase family enzyme